MAHIDQGEILWILPAQWTRSGEPDGFAMRVVDLLGRDGANPTRIWVRGVALDRATDLPVQEIVIEVPADQPRANRNHLRDPHTPAGILGALDPSCGRVGRKPATGMNPSALEPR